MSMKFSMITVILIFVGFAHGIIGDVLFAKEYTDIELHCPYPSTSVTWTNPNNTLIAIHGKINPDLINMHKYKINNDSENEHTLLFMNISSLDEGVYRCLMDMNANQTKYEINLNLCSTPVETEPFQEHIRKNLTDSIGVSENYICNEILPVEDDIVEGINLWAGKLSFRNNDESQLSVFESSSIYNCLQINEQFCSLNRSFYLNTTWISDAKEHELGQVILPLKYSYRCNDSHGKDSMAVFYSGKVLYLQNWKQQPQENVVCFLKKEMEIHVQVQGIVHAIIAVSGVFVIAMSVLLCLHIQGTIWKKMRNFEVENPNYNRGSRGSQSEEYSSIERRQQIILGQQVSYSVVQSRNSNAIPQHYDSSIMMDSVDDEIGNMEAAAFSTVEQPKAHELQYIDVQINNNSSEAKFIIGDDRRTPYADIDLNLKADPLPESDSSSEENEEKDDFMTLEDMQALMRARDSVLDEKK